MIEIKKVNPKSLAKFEAAIATIFILILAIFMFLLSLLSLASPSSENSINPIYVIIGIIPAVPLLALFVYISGLLQAFFYNIIASKIGGIKVELEAINENTQKNSPQTKTEMQNSQSINTAENVQNTQPSGINNHLTQDNIDQSTDINDQAPQQDTNQYSQQTMTQ